MILKEKSKFWLGTAIFIGLPPLLMYLGVFGEGYHISRIVLVAVLMVYLFLIRKKNVGWHDLGRKPEVLKKGILPHLLFTIFGIGAFILVFNPDLNAWGVSIDILWIFVIGNIIGSFIQELILHGYLGKYLIEYTRYHVVEYVLAGVLYTWIHLPLVNTRYELLITFPFFMVWRGVRKKYPNICLATASHCILNLFVTGLGLFSVFG